MCQGTIFRSTWEITRIKWSVNDVPRSLRTAQFGAITKQIWAFTSPRWRWSRRGPSNGNSCCDGVRSVARSFHFIRSCQSLVTTEERIRFAPAPLSRRHVVVSVTEIAGLYDTRSLIVVSAVGVMSLTGEGNSSDSTSETAYLRDFFVLSISAPILGKWKDPRVCVLAVF